MYVYTYMYVIYIYIYILNKMGTSMFLCMYVYIYIHVAWGIPPAFLKLLLVICSQEHLSVGFFEKETVETIF